jgi:hypothetical protein
LLAEEPGTAEVIEQGVIDVVRLGPDQVRKELAEIAERYGQAPLLAIVPDPAAARLAVLRACKQGFALTDKHAVRSRKGPFPFVTVLADSVAWDNGRLERLLESDETALPKKCSSPIRKPRADCRRRILLRRPRCPSRPWRRWIVMPPRWPNCAAETQAPREKCRYHD